MNLVFRKAFFVLYVCVEKKEKKTYCRNYEKSLKKLQFFQEVQSLKCFKSTGVEGQQFLEGIRIVSATELAKIVCKKQGISINSLTSDIWRMCSKGELSLVPSPAKAIFYTIKKELDDETVNEIINDEQAKREKRMTAFADFANAIENKESAENIVKKALNIY